MACNTANELGPALVANKATAFVGYNKHFLSDPGFMWMLKPDCIIDRELIKGNTVNQAVENARAKYTEMMNNVYITPVIIGALKQDRDALVVLGNGNAKLLQANNKDERWNSASQDEQQKSTSQDEQHSGEHNQIASQHERKNGCCSIS